MNHEAGGGRLLRRDCEAARSDRTWRDRAAKPPKAGERPAAVQQVIKIDLTTP